MKKCVLSAIPTLLALTACGQSEQVEVKSKAKPEGTMGFTSSASSTDSSKASSGDPSIATPRMDPKILGDGMAKQAADKMIDRNQKLDKALKDVDGN